MASFFKSTRKLPPKDLTGQVAIVTGSNTGIGYHIALELVSRGAHVILACRNTQKGEAAVQRVKAAVGQKSEVECWSIDQASFASVRSFVDRFKQSGLPLSLLVLNAGVLSNLRTVTDDGFETDWQVNHLASALLAQSLLPALRSWARTAGRGPARLLITSSEAHRLVKDPQVLFEDPSGTRLVKHGAAEGSAKGEAIKDGLPYGPLNTFAQYAKSKLAQLAWFLELARRQRDYLEAHPDSGQVVVHACDPGTVKSELGSKPSKVSSVGESMAYFVAGKILMPVIGVTPRQGAQTDLWVALSDEHNVTDQASSGGYWMNQKLATPRKELLDPAFGQRVWEQAEKEAGTGSDLF